MKKILSTGACALILTLFFGSFSPAFAYDSYQSFRARPISLNVNLQYYKTDANFNADGSKVNLLSGHTFQNISLNPKMRWQFGSSFALIGGFNYGNAESNDASFIRKNALVNRIDLATEYLFLNQTWMRLFGRLSYAHSLEKIDFNGDAALTSNGASEINPELILNLDFEGGLSSFVKTGLSIRGEGLSTLGTYGLGSELKFSNFALGAAVLGQLTVKEDDRTQTASFRDSLNSRVNAGSKIFNAINPNAHNIELNFNFLMRQQSQFKIYTGTTLVGSNTSSGYYLGTQINWIFDYLPSRSAPAKNTPRRKDSELIFKEKTDDGVNQDIFKPVTPVSPDYIQQIEGSKNNLQETTEPDPDEMIQTKKIPKTTKGYDIKLRKVKKK